MHTAMTSQSADPLIVSLLCSFPPELALHVLDHLLEDTTFSLDESNEPDATEDTTSLFDDIDQPDAIPRYTPPVQIHLLPQPFLAEAERLLHQRWLRSEKSFENLWEFCVLHTFVLGHKDEFVIPDPLDVDADGTMKLPPAMSPHPALPFHGLEKIRLDLSSDDYFAFFKVGIPPFNENLCVGTTLNPAHVATTFLKYTEELTIHFGSLYHSFQPWSSERFAETEWDEVGVDSDWSRFREPVCTVGQHVDWILSYAWHHKIVQHIPVIKVTGDVQPWVVEKWNRVFSGTHPQQEHIGMDDAVQAGVAWRPQAHYPAWCKCESPARGCRVARCCRRKVGHTEPEGVHAPWGIEYSLEEEKTLRWSLCPCTVDSGVGTGSVASRESRRPPQVRGPSNI